MQEELFPFPVRHVTAVIYQQTREYIGWRWSLSCVHSVMMVFSAQLAEGGGTHPFALYLPPNRVTQYIGIEMK